MSLSQASVCVLLSGFISSSAFSEEVFREDFEKNSPATELRNRIEQASNVLVVFDGSSSEERLLEVTFKATNSGSEGISTSIPLGVSGTHLALSYELEFDDEFVFSRGGKLPGLGPEKPVTGGAKVTRSGWSVRPMWREEGLLTSYTYHQDQPGKTGDYRRSDDFRFEKGMRYRVTVDVRLNSSSEKSDGVARILVDGVERVRHEGIQFYQGEEKEGRIARLLFSTFHGGNNESWTPRDEDGKPKDVTARFDSIVVSDAVSR